MRMTRAVKLKGLLWSITVLAALTLMISTASATITYTQKASMLTSRSFLAAAEVNGIIYTFGGYYWPTPYDAGFRVVEEYNPATNTWAAKAPMSMPREEFAAAAVNGKIYIMGGSGASAAVTTTTVEEYDPQTDTWTIKAPMPTMRRALAAAVVNNKIYAIGGSYQGVRDVIEEYDPATDTWTTKTPMPTAREWLAAASLDGKIYVAGGLPGDASRKLEVYDPATDTWATKAPIPNDLVFASAAAIKNKLYVFGADWWARNQVYKYDPATDSWSRETDVPYDKFEDCAPMVVINDKAYTFGVWGDSRMFEISVPEAIGNTQATIGPAAELTLNPETLEFGNVSPTVGNYTQTRVATVKSNKNWELFVRKLGDLTGANTADVIPSAQLTFTSAAQGSPVEFNLADTLVNSGAPTGGTDSNVDYALNVGWEDQPDSYSAQHIYTVVQP